MVEARVVGDERVKKIGEVRFQAQAAKRVAAVHAEEVSVIKRARRNRRDEHEWITQDKSTN